MTAPHEQLAFAADYPTVRDAEPVVATLVGAVGYLKVGLQLFVREGPAAVELGTSHGIKVFLDLKLHDIPATVDHAVGSACALGASLLTLHAAGGPAMTEAAARRVQREGADLKLLAVTVLTSLDDADLQRMGVQASAAEQVLRLGRLAVDAGAHGLVCSAHEVAALRDRLGPGPLLVTPGIRPAGAVLDDQKRVATPASAIRAGSSMLVVGRPIRDASVARAAAESICREIADASRA